MSVKKIAIAKAVLVLATLVPAAMLVVGIFTTGRVTFYAHHVINSTGDWGLRFLVVGLCVTPLRRVTGWHDLVQLRRTLGLAAFAYSVAHVVLWAQVDWGFELRPILARVLVDPFLATGTVAFVILIPLAVTSNRASMSRLGRRWQQLQWLTYVATVATLVHFWLKGPRATVDVQMWIAIVVVLLGFRLLDARRRRRPPQPPIPSLFRESRS